MAKDLISSSLTRQNILNNKYAIQEIQKAVGVQGVLFENEYRFTKKQVAEFFEVTERTIDNCLENLAWAGVPVLAYMMVGIPTETEEEAWESFNRLIKKYKEGYIKNVLYSLYSISKNSPIDKNPERFGVQILPMPQYIDLPCGAENFEHPGMSRDCAAKLQREFSARISEARTKAADEPENISSEETKSEVLCYMGEKIIPRADAEDISRTSYSNHAIMKIAIK